MGWLETQLPPVADFSPCFHKHQHFQIEPWDQPTNRLWQSSIRNPTPENCSPSFLTHQRTSFNPANFSLPSSHSCPQPLVARVELCRVFFLEILTQPHGQPGSAFDSLCSEPPTLQNLNGFRSSWCAKMRFSSIAQLPCWDVVVQAPAWFLPWPAACHSTPVVSRTTFGHSSTVKLLRSSMNQVFCLLSRTNSVWTSWGIAPSQVAGGGGWGLSMQTVTKCELIPLDLIFFTG